MLASVAAEDGVYEVVSPLGEPAVNTITVAPRFDGLEGKTIGEIWNGGFRGDESLPMIRTILQERYPTVKLIPYTESSLSTIVSFHPDKKKKTLDTLSAQIKEKRCDAVITGNGC